MSKSNYNNNKVSVCAALAAHTNIFNENENDADAKKEKKTAFGAAMKKANNKRSAFSDLNNGNIVKGGRNDIKNVLCAKKVLPKANSKANAPFGILKENEQNVGPPSSATIDILEKMLVDDAELNIPQLLPMNVVENKMGQMLLVKKAEKLGNDNESVSIATAKNNVASVVAPKLAPKTNEIFDMNVSVDQVQEVYHDENEPENMSVYLELVENIDAHDTHKLMMLSEYANDIYDYLFTLESEQPIYEDHMKDQKEACPRMRAVLIDWINEVHLQFRLVAETFYMAVAIIDRYLQKVKTTKRSQLQLVGVTALFLAAKYEEIYPPPKADFVYITDNTYTDKEVEQMEIKILRAIDFHLSRPLPIQFLRRFAKAANKEDYHYVVSKYFMELAAMEYEFASCKPSQIAAAALFLSLNLFDDVENTETGFNNTLWTPTLEHYSHYSAAQLRPTTRRLAVVVRFAPKAKLKATHLKYRSPKLGKISLRLELYSDFITSLIESKD